MSVRKAAANDARELQRLAKMLFGSADDCDFWDEQIFVHDCGNGRLGGYIAVSVRPWTEGTDARPAAHIEAWFVMPSLRRQGIGSRLMGAAEHWALLQGFEELCSDVETENESSLAAHAQLGFTPTLRLQYFRKSLNQAAKRVVGHG